MPWSLMRYSAETPEAPQHRAATTVTRYPRALGMVSFNCAPETIRTSDTRFRRAVLYPLSYEGVTSCPRPL